LDERVGESSKRSPNVIGSTPCVGIRCGQALDLTRVRHANKHQPAVTSIGQAEDRSGDLRKLLPVGARARSLKLNAPPFTGSDEFEEFLVSHGKASTGFAPQRGVSRRAL
jgi:hypothetical protein